MVALLEDAATILIIAMTGWVSMLFRRAYRQAGAPSDFLLSAAFAVICIYKFMQFVLGRLLSVGAFAWMDNEAASEGLIVLLAVVIIVVLAGVGARRRTAGDRH